MYSDVHLKMQSNRSNLKTKTELYTWSFREETKFSLKKRNTVVITCLGGS